MVVSDQKQEVSLGRGCWSNHCAKKWQDMEMGQEDQASSGCSPLWSWAETSIKGRGGRWAQYCEETQPSRLRDSLWVTEGLSYNRRGQPDKERPSGMFQKVSVEQSASLNPEQMDLSPTILGWGRALSILAWQGENREWKKESRSQGGICTYWVLEEAEHQASCRHWDSSSPGYWKLLLRNTKCVLLLINFPSATLWSACQWAVRVNKGDCVLLDLGVSSQWNSCN